MLVLSGCCLNHSPPGGAAGLIHEARCRSGVVMHRSSRGLAAIWLVGWVLVSPIVSAQDAKPIPLPAVQVDAPQQRQDARFKRRHGADRGGQSNRTAIQNPASVANAAPAENALGTSAAAAPVTSSSERNVSGEDVNARPFSRPAEALEVTPGLVVTQHSGDGKANQYFLRGFNLDHGTDLATSVEGVPVNMPTHAHGQGYTDLNFVIPELIRQIEYRKGTYYAETGN